MYVCINELSILNTYLLIYYLFILTSMVATDNDALHMVVKTAPPACLHSLLAPVPALHQLS